MSRIESVLNSALARISEAFGEHLGRRRRRANVLRMLPLGESAVPRYTNARDEQPCPERDKHQPETSRHCPLRLLGRPPAA
jgi:hypothetical protein